jgi:hypothetical protein
MASTSSSDFWHNLRDGVVGLSLDIARAKFIDVETVDDDRNIPDQADLRYGAGVASAAAGVAGSILPLMLVGVAIVGAVLLLKKAAK